MLTHLPPPAACCHDDRGTQCWCHRTLSSACSCFFLPTLFLSVPSFLSFFLSFFLSLSLTLSCSDIFFLFPFFPSFVVAVSRATICHRFSINTCCMCPHRP